MDLGFLDGAAWLNPPPESGRDGQGLWLRTGEKTDFWRQTHYGFVHDTGHALMAPVGDFTAEVVFEAEYSADFDQAGMMLWQSESHWIKAGIELSDGVLNPGAVVTRGKSDWSCAPAPGLTGPQRMRMTRAGDAVALEIWVAARWRLLRLADFPAGPARFGIMSCSPSRAGLIARWSSVTVGPPLDVVHAG